MLTFINIKMEKHFQNSTSDTQSWLLSIILAKKTLLQQGISGLIFYGDLVYKFLRIVGKPNVSDQFKKIIRRYKKLYITWILCDSMPA